MKRALVVAFALVSTYLVVSAMPVAAAGTGGQLVVGSQHTTDTDFESATELTNVTVQGTGDSGSIVLAETSGGIVDSFEDRDLAEWQGDSSGWTFGSGSATDGSTALVADSASRRYIYSTGGLSTHPQAGDTVKYDVELLAPSSEVAVRWGVQSSGSYYNVYMSDYTGDVRLEKCSSGSCTTLDSTSWDVPVDDQFTVSVDWQTDGTMEVDINNSGSTVVTLSGSDSTWSSGGVGLMSNDGETAAHAAFDNIRIAGASSISSAVYVSAPHSISNAEQAAINITELSNVSVDLDVEYYDGSSWQTGETATISSTGNHTLTLPSVSSDQWRVRVDVSKTDQDPTFSLDDESILFTNHAPQASNASLSGGETTRYSNATLSVDISDQEFGTAQGESVTADIYVDGALKKTTTVNSPGTVSYAASGLSDGSHSWHVELGDSYGGLSTSNTWSFEVDHFEPSIDNSSMSPSDGADLTTRETNFSVDLSDGDFAFEGDTLDATLYVDGTAVGTDTLTSNGTASVSHTLSVGGEHTYYWTVTDSYGQTTTSDTLSVSSPASLEIRRETGNHSLITENVDLRVQFYPLDGGNAIVREANNGKVDLTGLPVDQRFVVTVTENATDKWTYRRIVIDSIYETSTIYLLNSSLESSQVVFELQDPTGQFPPEETILYVEKAMTINGTTQYRTIAGDTFGSTGRFPVVLRDENRYRLRVATTDGSSERILGAYSVYGATVEPLQIQRIQPNSDASPGDIVYGSLDTLNGSANVAVRYQNLNGSSSNTVTYRIRRGESGQIIVPNTTTEAATFAHLHPVNTSASNSWTVEYWVDNGTATTSGEFVVGDVPGIAARLNADPQVLSIISWILILSTMGLLVIVDTKLAPIGGVGMASGLVIIGTVAIPAPILGMAGAVAVLTAFGGDT